MAPTIAGIGLTSSFSTMNRSDTPLGGQSRSSTALSEIVVPMGMSTAATSTLVAGTATSTGTSTVCGVAGAGGGLRTRFMAMTAATSPAPTATPKTATRASFIATNPRARPRPASRDCRPAIVYLWLTKCEKSRRTISRGCASATELRGQTGGIERPAADTREVPDSLSGHPANSCIHWVRG